MRKRKKAEASFIHALITVCLAAAIVFTGIAVLGAEPQIPLVFGCLTAGLMSIYLGYSWDEILEGMLSGISDSLEAVLILLLIGMLVGSWIAAGTVPSLICYGLILVSPKFFLPATMIICMFIAFAIGSWGTVGTMGLAFMGMGLALGIPAPMTAGAVISGAYMGEVISPLSDAANLTAGVTGGDVFAIIRKILPCALTAGIAAAALYLFSGIRYGSGGGQTVKDSVEPLLASLKSHFVISPLALLPMAVVFLCITLKLPSIPSMLAGASAGMLLAGLLQGVNAKDILRFSYEGYISSTGNVTVDTLLTAGGLKGMMESVSVILIAMAFGGIMKASKLMNALVSPLLKTADSGKSLTALTVVSCIGMNAILPDQYLSISMPGQMYAEAFDRKGISRSRLAAVILGGGAVTSPLIPWNSCGIYCRTVLGVRPSSYLPFAFYGMILPVVTIISGFLYKTENERS